MKIIKLFLRVAIGGAFLNAVAGRFGLWTEISAAESWQGFLKFTQLLNPWIPEGIIPFIGIVVTSLEIAFGILLLVGFKTELVAKLSGFLILSFAFAMLTSLGLKAVFDNSVLAISAAAFGLSTIKTKFMEVDNLLKSQLSI